MASKTDYEDNAKLEAAKERRRKNADKKMLREGFHGRAADLVEARGMAKDVLKPYKNDTNKLAMAKIEDAETGYQMGEIGRDRRFRNEKDLTEGSGHYGQDPKYMAEFAHGYFPKSKKVTRKPDYVSDRNYAKGGPVAKKGSAVITEKKTGETYKSKAAMKKHEAGETKSEQKAEMKKGYMKGGAAISGKRGKNMVAVSGPKVPNAVKAGSAKLGKK